MIFDGHNDLLTSLWLSSAKDPVHEFLHGTLPGHLDFKRCQEAQWMGGLFSIFLPPYGYLQKHHPEKIKDRTATDFSEEQIIEICTAQLEMAQQLQLRSEGKIQICTSLEQVKTCFQHQQLAIVLHLEGAEVLECEPKLLDTFYEKGLRSIGPLWNRKSRFGDGLNASFPHSPDTGSGLTEQGKELVRICENKGMIIDVSHMNERAFWDTADILKGFNQPIVATHSNVHALCAQARNLTDSQLQAIQRSHGMVGINFDVAFLRSDGQRDPNTSLDTIIDHLSYLLEHLGEDHIGFGSDFDGCLLPLELGDVTYMPYLLERMQQRGFSEALIEKISSQNWFNFLNQILKA